MVGIVEGVVIAAAVGIDLYAYKKMKDAEEEYERAKAAKSAETTVIAAKPAEGGDAAMKAISLVQHIETPEYARNMDAVAAPYAAENADIREFSKSVGRQIDNLSVSVSELSQKVEDNTQRICVVEENVFDLRNELHAAKSSSGVTSGIERKLKQDERAEDELFREADKLRIKEKQAEKRLKRINKKLRKTSETVEDEIKGRVSKKVFAKSLHALHNELSELKARRAKKRKAKAAHKTAKHATIRAAHAKAKKAKTRKTSARPMKKTTTTVKLKSKKSAKPVEVKVTTQAPSGTNVNTQITEKK